MSFNIFPGKAIELNSYEAQRLLGYLPGKDASSRELREELQGHAEANHGFGRVSIRLDAFDDAADAKKVLKRYLDGGAPTTMFQFSDFVRV